MVGLGQGEEGRPTPPPPGHPSGSGDPLPVGQRPRWTLLPARATAAATLAWWPAMLTLPTLAATAKAALPLWLTTLVPPRFIVVRAGRSSICWSSNMVSPRIGGDMQCARRGPQPSPADSPAGPVDADPGRGPVSTAPTLAPRRATGNGGRHVFPPCPVPQPAPGGDCVHRPPYLSDSTGTDICARAQQGTRKTTEPGKRPRRGDVPGLGSRGYWTGGTERASSG